MYNNRIKMVYFWGLLLVAGGLSLLRTYNVYPDNINESSESALKLRFLLDKHQELSALYENYSNTLVNFNPNNFTICGIIRENADSPYIKQSLIELSEIENSTIDFDSENMIWSANRRIVKVLYPTKGTNEPWSKLPVHYLKIVLSKEYYANTVFYYAIEKKDYSLRPKVYYPTVYDDYTQIEQ